MKNSSTSSFIKQAPALNTLYAFNAALSEGNAAAAAACFTRQGCLITPDGTAIHGRSEIRGIIAQLIARRTEIEVEQVVVREAGDVALISGWLTMRSDGTENVRLAQSCSPTLAMRRVEESWKIAILAPWTGR